MNVPANVPVTVQKDEITFQTTLPATVNMNGVVPTTGPVYFNMSKLAGACSASSLLNAQQIQPDATGNYGVQLTAYGAYCFWVVQIQPDGSHGPANMVTVRIQAPARGK
jgi:hypothetical protein